jgi:hypothetical protein
VCTSTFGVIFFVKYRLLYSLKEDFSEGKSLVERKQGVFERSGKVLSDT